MALTYYFIPYDNYLYTRESVVLCLLLISRCISLLFFYYSVKDGVFGVCDLVLEPGGGLLFEKQSVSLSRSVFSYSIISGFQELASL